VPSWTFLTAHTRVLLLVARDPGVRLRDIANSLDITERSAFSIVSDLVEQERPVGEVLALLAGTDYRASGRPAARRAYRSAC